MGRTHALTGWCAGLAVAPTVGLVQVHEAVVFAATTAGFALLPDLDHPRAPVSRLFGPVTGALSSGLRGLSTAVFRATRTEQDWRRAGAHRHLSHTLVFAIVFGGVVAAVTALTGPAGVTVVVGIALLLASRVLGTWLFVAAASSAALWLATSGTASAGALAGWLGLAVALGCTTHAVGDTLTESGCPLLWPIRIRGHAWYELRPPAGLRFRTGRAVEHLLVSPLFAVLGVLLIPGAWPVVVHLAASIP